MKHLKTVMAASAGLLLAGCTTMNDAQRAEGSGAKSVYEASFGATWDAVICSLEGRGIGIAEKDKGSGRILAQKGVSAFSWGENVAVFVRKKTAAQTEVEVVSKRVVQPNVLATDWSGDVLGGVASCLKK